MWIILLSLLLIAGGSAAEIDCDKDFVEQCRVPRLFRDIPTEVEEFEELCLELSPFAECERDYDLKCGKEDSRRFIKPEKYADLIALFDEVCEEGSPLNEVAKSSLKCLNETFSNTNCEQEMIDFFEPYLVEVPLNEFTTTHQIPERVQCISEILFGSCLVADITRTCGIRTSEATIEFLHRASYFDVACPSKYIKSLLPDIDEYNLTEKQKIFAISELERLLLLEDM